MAYRCTVGRHHFQLARQLELPLPKFRKSGGNNACVEGPQFNLGQFHEAVLAEGGLPLALLGNRVNDWIARAARGQTPVLPGSG